MLHLGVRWQRESEGAALSDLRLERDRREVRKIRIEDRRGCAEASARCGEHLARKRRVVGMDLTEYSYVEGQNASAFLCAKLIYKTLSFVFDKQTERVRNSVQNRSR